MMNCKKCGKELAVGANFCMFCGEKVGVLCPKCGTELPDEAKFCFKCGAAINTSPATQRIVTDVSRVKSISQETILDQAEMARLSQIKKQQEEESQESRGAPVWDKTPTGVCDCSVGECDCDGSIWN